MQAADVQPGATIYGGPDAIPCTVLSVHHVPDPITGLPVVRLWCRRADTGATGYVTYGPSADVQTN